MVYPRSQCWGSHSDPVSWRASLTFPVRYTGVDHGLVHPPSWALLGLVKPALHIPMARCPCFAAPRPSYRKRLVSLDGPRVPAGHRRGLWRGLDGARQGRCNIVISLRQTLGKRQRDTRIHFRSFPGLGPTTPTKKKNISQPLKERYFRLIVSPPCFARKAPWTVAWTERKAPLKGPLGL